MAQIYKSDVAPFGEYDQLSIAQFMTRYNPDDVLPDKVVHTDSFSSTAITYGGLRRDAARLAWGLRERLGVREGDIVLALVPNSNDFVLLAHGTWWAGAVFAPMNVSATQKDIEHVLKVVRPTHVATTVQQLKAVESAAQNVAAKLRIFTVLEKAENIILFPSEVIGSNDTESLPPYDLGGKSGKDVPSTICFSSGTTGNVKGVQLSHFNVIANTMQGRMAIPSRTRSSTRKIWFTPYCHIYGLAFVVITGMWVGDYNHALSGFDLEEFCRKTDELKGTDMYIVPPIALLLTGSPIAAKYKMESISRIVVAAAPIKKSLQLLLKKRFPQACVNQGYGLSETSPSVAGQFDNDNAECGGVGRLIPGTELRLVDPQTGKEVEPGAEGEIWLRGPQIMMGYVNDEKATKETFVGEWLKTGDIGKIDKVGQLWITDRLKEMIKYKGFQVAPSELEDLLNGHPDVIDAAVCGIYDDAQATEIPLAYVSLTKEKANLPAEQKSQVLADINKWANKQLAGYKKLRGGVFHLQALPKNPTGKIMRRLLPAKLKAARENKL